ncbi:MAG TPA: ADP-ribosylglycohydrolase family protein [Phycisphaerae bacterium]|nr:ADP-ribosylglycohydrolase family protein [Phycisphaerae bacterium]HOJ73023.1 ADP-ribosylglycohydrolase family protein [Phycisphaerae bacterium]HOM50207.1 ADP-ribosylglycohydrolase family protein [Phycisphaerae bacterium]HOQ86798.1 ADP-ribosylglycohydrolase family protein [Phycisphaerae bacterium]HPP26490.1 ADP-ribosylglycohydrolase family protein [Phycisphaerae bacterium]
MRNAFAAAFVLWIPAGLTGCAAQTRQIAVAEYHDKVYASWLGQCIGNMYGLAHEFKYNDEPRTEPIPGWADETLQRMREHNGAFSDDDTDIEYVDLFCMEKYGPEPTYENLAEFWKKHINRYIWVANYSARDLMNRGYLPPHTGRRGINTNWFQIDPQLVCEIWAVTAPGMLEYSAAKADWAAKVTNDQYGTHPTIWYNVMWSAAFFESDVEKLCQIGYEALPEDSIFRTAIDDVRRWKAEHGSDWVAVRKKIKEKYHDGVGLPEGTYTGRVSALLNGTLGVLALLYGEGDFEKTMNYACMAGYDADNQCATLAGLVAIIHGSRSLPRKYTHPVEGWTLPLNDFYKNRTRDNLPDGKLTDIARRTAKLGIDLVVAHGGRVEGSGDDAVLVINTAARFTPPLEVRLYPIRLQRGESVTVEPEIIGGDPKTARVASIAGVLPSGMDIARDQQGRLVLTGTPRKIGDYEVEVRVEDRTTTRTTKLPLFVREKNLALSASKVLAAVTKPTGTGSRDRNVLRDEMPKPAYDSYDGENTLAEDFYGYEWEQPVSVGRIKVQFGPVFPNGGWFESVAIQYRSGNGAWTDVQNLRLDPPFNVERARRGEFRFEATFQPVTTTAIRLVGKPGGSAEFTSIAELSVHEK